jgi:GAF domain-containing protein
LSLLPGVPLEAVLAGLVVLVARLLAGDPLPEDYLERRPPVRADQVRALQAMSKTLSERRDLQPLLEESHHVILSHTGATRAAVVLLDEPGDTGQAYTFADGDVQTKLLAFEADGAAPHERVVRGEALRLTRQREPLPVVEVLGGRGASSFLGVPLRTSGATLGALLAYDKDGGRAFLEQDEAFLDLLGTSLAAALYGGRSASEAAERGDVFTRGLVAMLTLQRPEQEAHAE